MPSGDIIWRADTGWLHRMVIVPMSRKMDSASNRDMDIGSIKLTCMTLEPYAVRLHFLLLCARVAE